MLTFDIDRSDPTKEVSTGMQICSEDDPVELNFTLDHAKGATHAEIVADIKAYLVTEARTPELVEREAKFRIASYNPEGQITSIKRYAVDNGDGTYSDLVEEDSFTVQGGRVLSDKKKKFDSNGVVGGEVDHTYFTSANGDDIIRKRTS